MNPKSGFAIFKTRFFYVLLGVLVGMLLPSAFALADNPINLVVNGQAVQCDVPPVIINGRTMVPIRTVAEALGCQVSWDASSNSVIISSKSTTPTSTVSPEIQNYVNAVSPILKDAANIASDINNLMNQSYPTTSSGQLALANQLESYASIISGDMTTLIQIQTSAPQELQPFQAQLVQELSSYSDAIESINSGGLIGGTNPESTTAQDMNTAETALQRANAIANTNGVSSLNQ